MREFSRRGTSILGIESCRSIVEGGLITSPKYRVQDHIPGCFIGIVPTGGAHVDFDPVCRDDSDDTGEASTEVVKVPGSGRNRFGLG